MDVIAIRGYFWDTVACFQVLLFFWEGKIIKGSKRASLSVDSMIFPTIKNQATEDRRRKDINHLRTEIIVESPWNISGYMAYHVNIYTHLIFLSKTKWLKGWRVPAIWVNHRVSELLLPFSAVYRSKWKVDFLSHLSSLPIVLHPKHLMNGSY